MMCNECMMVLPKTPLRLIQSTGQLQVTFGWPEHSTTCSLFLSATKLQAQVKPANLPAPGVKILVAGVRGFPGSGRLTITASQTDF